MSQCIIPIPWICFNWLTIYIPKSRHSCLVNIGVFWSFVSSNKLLLSFSIMKNSEPTSYFNSNAHELLSMPKSMIYGKTLLLIFFLILLKYFISRIDLSALTTLITSYWEEASASILWQSKMLPKTPLPIKLPIMYSFNESIHETFPECDENLSIGVLMSIINWNLIL